MSPDWTVVNSAKSGLHIADVDHFAFRKEAGNCAEALEAKFPTEGTSAAWCSEAMGLYGRRAHPEGRAAPVIRPAAPLCAILLLVLSGMARGEDLARPDSTMTPGAVDPHVTLADICTGHTKERRHVSPATRAKVLSDYNVTDVASVGMELDHLVPLALDGANTAANLWPHPSPDYEIKDRIKVESQRRVCVAYRMLLPAEAAGVLAQERSPRTGRLPRSDLLSANQSGEKRPSGADTVFKGGVAQAFSAS